MLLVPFIYLLMFAAGIAATYWIVRLAVRHAIEDADKRRSRAPRP
ncbi:hypothetical protein [Glycomyces tenuis]|nr:hypothetical protein [Glycomyces tenuis]